jgi:hypothetical protein
MFTRGLIVGAYNSVVPLLWGEPVVVAALPFVRLFRRCNRSTTLLFSISSWPPRYYYATTLRNEIVAAVAVLNSALEGIKVLIVIVTVTLSLHSAVAVSVAVAARFKRRRRVLAEIPCPKATDS